MNLNDAKLIIKREIFERSGYNYINNFDVAFQLTDSRVNQGKYACKSNCVANMVNEILGTNFSYNDTFTENSEITKAVNNMNLEQTELFINKLIDNRISGYINASSYNLQKSDFIGWMNRLFKTAKTERELDHIYNNITDKLVSYYSTRKISKKDFINISYKLDKIKNKTYDNMFSKEEK